MMKKIGAGVGAQRPQFVQQRNPQHLTTNNAPGQIPSPSISFTPRPGPTALPYNSAAQVPEGGRELDYYYNEAARHASRAKELANQRLFAEAATAYDLAMASLKEGQRYFYQIPQAMDALSSHAERYATAARSMRERAKAAPGAAAATEGHPEVAVSTQIAGSNAASAADETFVTERPSTRYKDVIGVDDAINSIRDAVELPLKYPSAFAALQIEPWAGILLCGPPGTGKTMLAQAAAGENECAFFNVKGSSIMAHLVGQSEKRVAEIFDRAAKCAPSIIFIDECDALMGVRTDNENEGSRRVKTELLTAMQGFKRNKGVLVMGATNYPEKLDPALLRRFQQRLWIGLPDQDGRTKMFASFLQGLPHTFSQLDYQDFADRTQNYTGADIGTVVNAAKLAVLKRTVTSPFMRNLPDGTYAACQATDAGAVEVPTDTRTLQDIHWNVRLQRQDVLDALAKNRPAVSPAELRQFIETYEKSKAAQ